MRSCSCPWHSSAALPAPACCALFGVAQRGAEVAQLGRRDPGAGCQGFLCQRMSDLLHSLCPLHFLGLTRDNFLQLCSLLFPLLFFKPLCAPCWLCSPPAPCWGCPPNMAASLCVPIGKGWWGAWGCWASCSAWRANGSCHAINCPVQRLCADPLLESCVQGSRCQR